MSQEYSHHLLNVIIWEIPVGRDVQGRCWLVFRACSLVWDSCGRALLYWRVHSFPIAGIAKERIEQYFEWTKHYSTFPLLTPKRNEIYGNPCPDIIVWACVSWANILWMISFSHIHVSHWNCHYLHEYRTFLSSRTIVKRHLFSTGDLPVSSPQLKYIWNLD